MILRRECLRTSIPNKAGRTNQHAKPPFEGVYSVWRLNHTKKLTFNNRKVNELGVAKTDLLAALRVLVHKWRDRATAPRLKPEYPHTGRIRIGIKTNAIPYPHKPNQAGLKTYER